MYLRSVVHTSLRGGRWRRLVVTVCSAVIVLTALLVSLASLALAAPGTFPDVPTTHPYYDAISDLASRGVIAGYDNGNFGPGDPVKRQQFAKMAVLVGGYPVTEGDICSFADVEKSDASTFYPDNYVAVCAANGITTGTTATTFDPYAYITRYQVVSMVVRMADNLQPGLLATPPSGWSGEATWAADPTHGANAARAEHNGLLTGLDLSALDPHGNMSRGEVAQVLHNLLGMLTPASTTTTTDTPTTPPPTDPVVGPSTSASVEVYIDGELVATSTDGVIADSVNPAYTIATTENELVDPPDVELGDLVLNSANVEVHVKDSYGNELADYEVVYLLENIGEWLIGSQNAADTYLPLAYLVDLDECNPLPWPPTDDTMCYDGNGELPDANEPNPKCDPASYIVGPGYIHPDFSFMWPDMYDPEDHEARFFNQALGSDKPHFGRGQPGVPKWWDYPLGLPFMAYTEFFATVWDTLVWTWPDWVMGDPRIAFSGFDGVWESDGLVPPGIGDLDDQAWPDYVGLATDGAKAWTLDGYTCTRTPNGGNAELILIPNLLTGSNIDIQLAEIPWYAEHAKSILRIMVYALADGIVREGSPIYSAQVHKVWEMPEPDTIELGPAYQVKAAGYDDATVQGRVLDQFGRPYPFVDVDLYVELFGEGSGLTNGGGLPLMTLTTDENGNFSFTWSEAAADWGPVEAWAEIGFIESDEVVVYWAVNDDGEDDYTDARWGSNAVHVRDLVPDFPNWNGMATYVHLSITEPSLNTHDYLFQQINPDNVIDLTYTFPLGRNAYYWVNIPGTYYDGVPDWIWGRTESGAVW